jgi:diaminopimelate epimerase
MTGSGNDFVFFDGREVDGAVLRSPEVIQAICSRHNGIGADGIVILEPLKAAGSTSDATGRGARIVYFNSDGTPADLCGNATLCSTTMAVELGIAAAAGMTLETPAGQIASRLVDGVPEIQLQPVRHVNAAIPIGMVTGEERVGFAIAGIPHLVVLCRDADSVDVPARGPVLRHDPQTGPAGANVNWVSPLTAGLWRYRTFERGVEGETLACGTGAVATAVLLTIWGLAESPVRIRTSSGRELVVTLRTSDDAWVPTLRGEGRLVFRGHLGDVIG